MANDGQIVFEVTADGKHAIADIKDITAAIQKETKNWDKAAEQSTDNISKSFSGMLKKLVAGFSAVKIGQALLNIGKDALEAASALEEVQNVVDVTFGNSASTIDRWAKNAGTQFGLTETQAKKFASTMGAMMKSSGMAGEEIVSMSTDLAGLAADMASFYNLDFDTAFQKIRSGISGETEPLKQLGINMSVANLEAYALTQGITKAFNEMSQGEQTMLRYQYLMQATADAQGDFARTSDGYANSMRKLETNITAIQTALGETFKGVVTEATNLLNGFLELLIPTDNSTVLDDFAEIDLNTEAKLADITKVAEQARLLTEELDKINGEKTEKAKSNVQQLVTDLTGIDLSDTKANSVKSFIDSLSNNIDTLANIQGKSNEEVVAWLNGIAGAANSLNESDVSGWESLVGMIKEGLPGFENTDVGKSFFEKLTEGYNSVDVSGIKGFIETLTNDIETVKRLQGSDATEAKAWLDGIRESAEQLDPNDVAGWTSLLEEIRKGLPGIDNTEYGAAFTSLADGLSKLAPRKKTLDWLAEKAPSAGTGLQEFANSLNGININQDKAGAVKDFVSVLAQNIPALQEITGESAEGVSEWLSNIGSAADDLDPADAEGWATLIGTIKEGLPGIEDTEFGSSFFEALSGGFSDVKDGTSVLDWAIDTLGNKTERTAEEQALWLETCKQLVKTIPGLSSIINTETGEIKGGTQAVKDYIKAWEEGQTKLALIGALEQKESALSTRFADLPGLQLDMALAQKKLRDQQNKIQQMADNMGITVDFSRLMHIGGNQPNMWTAEQKEFNAAVDEYYKLNRANIEATEAYNKQKEALDEAKQALIEYREAIEEEYGSIEEAKEAGVEWSEEMKANAQTLVEAAKESLTELADYAQSVEDSVAKAIDGVAKGLEKVNYHRFNEINTKVSELIEKQAALGSDAIGTEAWKELENEIKKYNDQLITTESIYSNLESQKTFLEDYLSNLAKAQAMGLSAELLSALSDGSVESAQFLDALVNDTEGTTAADIDKLYQEVQAKKKQLTGALTEQQLAADQVYQSMAEEAKKAVEALDLESEAAENSGKTVAGIAQGIASHVSEVQIAVDSILEQLNRLSAWGISFDIGTPGGGSVNIPHNYVFEYQGEFETGLDRVPFDGFLASLHEGEGILTAEENRVWQRFKNGESSTDYETLGGVMRDNIKAGGNVYLDGRVVGAVISDQQGKSYRQLQRSGWQS